MNTHRLSAPLVCASTLAFFLAGGAALGVNIDVTIDPPGPVAIGDTVTVNLAVSGWQAADGEVDGVCFRVAFDPALFEFVAGSGVALNDGNEFLALPTQGAGYSLTDNSIDSFANMGLYLFCVRDDGDFANGSIGPSGPLGSFRLKALAAGNSDINPSAGDPDEVFADINLNGIAPTGGVSFNALPVTSGSSGLTYAIWAAGIPFPPGEGDPEDDPDGDKVTNVMEYGLEMDPLVQDRAKLPAHSIIEVGGKDYLSYVYQRPAGSIVRTDLKYAHRRSTDLESWATIGVTESVSAPDPVTELETVVVRSSTPVGAGGLTHEFLDLEVNL